MDFNGVALLVMLAVCIYAIVKPLFRKRAADGSFLPDTKSLNDALGTRAAEEGEGVCVIHQGLHQFNIKTCENFVLAPKNPAPCTMLPWDQEDERLLASSMRDINADTCDHPVDIFDSGVNVCADDVQDVDSPDEPGSQIFGDVEIPLFVPNIDEIAPVITHAEEPVPMPQDLGRTISPVPVAEGDDATDSQCKIRMNKCTPWPSNNNYPEPVVIMPEIPIEVYDEVAEVTEKSGTNDALRNLRQAIMLKVTKKRVKGVEHWIWPNKTQSFRGASVRRTLWNWLIVVDGDPVILTDNEVLENECGISKCVRPEHQQKANRSKILRYVKAGARK